MGSSAWCKNNLYPPCSKVVQGPSWPYLCPYLQKDELVDNGERLGKLDDDGVKSLQLFDGAHSIRFRRYIIILYTTTTTQEEEERRRRKDNNNTYLDADCHRAILLLTYFFLHTPKN